MSRPIRYHAVPSPWAYSVLAPHPEAPQAVPATSWAAWLSLLKNALSKALSEPTAPGNPRPRLPRPKTPPLASWRPSRPFSTSKAPTPIWQLLTESQELPRKRPVPHTPALLRSLCKGHGTLRMSEQGLVYLELAPGFLDVMLPYLQVPGLARLTSVPHVPVIPQREACFHFLEKPQELGSVFSFEIEGLYSVRPDAWAEAEEVWFFQIRCPELEALRQKYFLPTRPGGHAFHIAVAMRPRERIESPPMLRINPAFLVA